MGKAAADALEIVSIGVGHGDATLVSWRPAGSEPFHMLVDGGPKGAGGKIWRYLEEANIGCLDLLVLSHVDADHVDGLLELAEKELSIKTYWGPCIEAFVRHDWLFADRIKSGLKKAQRLQDRLAEQDTVCLYPLEGFQQRSGDEKLDIQVLWPPPRLIEKLLLDDDTLSLFSRYPMPQGWLLSPQEAPVEEGRDLAAMRAQLRTTFALEPSETVSQEFEPPSNVDGLAGQWAKESGMHPEFFGNSVLNDTSLVLNLEAQLDGKHRRRVLLPGDLENWLYLESKHSNGIECDVLKAPHHGGRVYIEEHGREAYDEVYQWLRPNVVTVSATGRHALPRAEFREVLQRWGATLFCSCRRTREIVVGERGIRESGEADGLSDQDHQKSCHAIFQCEGGDTTTKITVTASRVEADAAACVFEATQERARVVRVIQHVIDPSGVVERMNTGELHNHIHWLKRLLGKLHRDRPKVEDWRIVREAIDIDLLKQRAAADGRHRLFSEMESVLERAASRGDLWYRPETYEEKPARGYRNPTQAHQKQAWDWFLTRFAVVMKISDQPNRGRTSLVNLAPLEILHKADTDVVARQITADLGYPLASFRNSFWPDLASRLHTGWHGYIWGEDASLLVVSSHSSVDKLADAIRSEIPQELHDAFLEYQESSSFKSELDSDRAWELYEELGKYVFLIGWKEQSQYSPHEYYSLIKEVDYYCGELLRLCTDLENVW